MKKVLMTGAAGLIGTILRSRLKDTYDFTYTDKEKISEPRFYKANMTDLGALRLLAKGQEAIIHLAWNTRQENWPGMGFTQENVLGIRTVFEAAKLEGVKKVVFASSSHVTGMYEKYPPYSNILSGNYDLVMRPFPLLTVDMPLRPDSPYGASKIFGETLGRFYSEEFGISICCIRIGTVNRTGKPGHARQFATLLTHRDLAQLIDKSLNFDISYGIFYGVSDNYWRFWDITNAKEILHYRSIDDAEEFRIKKEME